MLDGYKTYVGIAVMLLSQVLQARGIELGDTVGLTNEVLALIGAALAIYGRFAAKSKEVK